MAEKVDRTIEAGKLRFHTYYRAAGADSGPAVEVFAETAPGRWREVLRYDCFAQEPHRHYFKADGVEEREGYPGGVAESVTAAKKELTELPAILGRIGYGDVAGQLSAKDLQEAVTTVQSELTALETRGGS